MSLDYGYGDAHERELAEREDAAAEEAQAALHADTWWCPTCRQPTLTTRRNRRCLFCESMTLPASSGQMQERTDLPDSCPSSRPRRQVGVGDREPTTEEKDAA